MKPRWIVYDRSGDSYPVALDTALDQETARRYLSARMLPGQFETIRCSSRDTAQRIADWLNGRVDGDGDA